MTTPTVHTPDSLVTEFCARWRQGTADELTEYFTDDATYHNIPMQAVTGREAIRDFLRGFLGTFGGIDFQVRHQVSAGNLVMNERVDSFTINEQRIDLPVTGVFEIVDGRIHAWRDYFDMATVTAALQG
ncbi:limonene-1,2-epoxide hydrolase [Nocardia mangyaensis]|uniref:Limonene-1,2-epoxide hydrolase n=1 Tax=Nocardia mangyaensis TaxID=2213200 RepID=A0A1J0VTQ6_9NOCA|nr:limonene-1,2-epoxide hydrolase family protein [Nocardia mangyaensis]APE35401.1 limonene-1,2-epoxide hydrolase [Nocardia mangyaensis]